MRSTLYGKDDPIVLCANNNIKRARHVIPISESLSEVYVRMTTGSNYPFCIKNMDKTRA